MEEEIKQIKGEVTGLKAHVEDCPAKKVLEDFAKEGIRLEEKRIKVIKKKTEEDTLKKYGITKHAITKLLLVTILAPILTAITIVIRDFLISSIWSWKPLLIAFQITIIPDIVLWMRATFNKKDLEREKEITKVKQDYNDKEKLLTQQIHAEKINAEVRKNEIVLLNKEITRLRNLALK